MKKTNRNFNGVLDVRYANQQNAIKGVCNELGLVCYLPSYHANKTDCNTVIIFTKEGHEFNEENDRNGTDNEERGRICCFKNTDRNGLFDLNFMNGGTIDFRGDYTLDEIRKYVKKCYDEYNKKGTL